MDGGKRDRTRHKSNDEIKGRNEPLNISPFSHFFKVYRTLINVFILSFLYRRANFFPILNGIKIKMVILRKNNSIARNVRDYLQQNQ